MPLCPICQTEYLVGKVEPCSTCGWDLKYYHQSLLGIFDQKAEAFKQAEIWAKQMWQERQKLQVQLSESSKLQLKPGQASAEQTQPQNNLQRVTPDLAENAFQLADEFETQIEQQKQDGEERRLLVNLLQSVLEKISQGQLLFGSQQSELQGVLEKVSEERSQLQLQVPALREELIKANEEQKVFQSQLLALQDKLEKVKQERSRPQLHPSELQAVFQKLDENRAQLQSQIDGIKTRLEALEPGSIASSQTGSSYRVVGPPEIDRTPVHQYTQIPESRSRPAATHLHLSSEEATLVATYNRNSNVLSPNALEVSETEESIEERRLGSSQAAVLEQDRNGNYWIITGKDRSYLVPKAGKIKINAHNYQTVQSLFECHDYQLGGSSEFKLIKPGKIAFISTVNKWQLVEPGILQF